MKTKRYKLKRDLPTFKAGDIFYLSGMGNLFHESEGVVAYSWSTIDKFPNILTDWFEEIKPAEPLIKDEKIRKAVRAWAEANGREYLLVIKSGGRLEVSDGSPHLIYISFHVDNDTLKSLDDRTYYPIAELCGEEEEWSEKS